jgi:hypothetical protein
MQLFLCMDILTVCSKIGIMISEDDEKDSGLDIDAKEVAPLAGLNMAGEADAHMADMALPV